MSARGLGTVVLRVDGKPLPSAIDETVLATTLVRTIEGASTVVVTARDPEKALQQSGFFERKAEALLDGLPFIACAETKKTDEYTLTFEDREFHELREDTTPARVTRGPNMTLAHFVKLVCKRVCPHADFVCPELDLIQPVEQKKAGKTPKKGIPRGTVKIGGVPIDADQENNINIVLGVCDSLNVPTNARIAIVCAALGESNFKTHDRNNLGADGVFQLLPETAQRLHLSPYDTKGTAEHWLNKGYWNYPGGIKLAQEGLKPGDIANRVEGSHSNLAEGAAYYEKYRGEAEEIINAGGGTSGTKHHKSKSVSHTTVEPVVFELNGKEETESNTLAGIESYAQKYGWRFYKVGTDFHFIHDAYLIKTRPALTISEETPGIIDIGWELDRNEKVKTSVVTVECRAGMWTAEPGAVIKLAQSVGKELSKGNWLVSKIERKDVTDNATVIELTRPQKAIAEPADVVKTVSEVVKSPKNPEGAQQIHQGGPNAGQLTEDSHLYNALFQMRWIDKQKYPYVLGGGHGPDFQATTGEKGFSPEFSREALKQIGYDCSGAVSSVLGRGGLLSHPYTTEGLEYWGQPGEGKYLTVWVRSVPDGHCFIEVNVPVSLGPENTGGKTLIFVAHRPGTTVGFGHESHTEGNWKPRHWPGL